MDALGRDRSSEGVVGIRTTTDIAKCLPVHECTLRSDRGPCAAASHRVAGCVRCRAGSGVRPRTASRMANSAGEERSLPVSGRRQLWTDTRLTGSSWRTQRTAASHTAGGSRRDRAAKTCDTRGGLVVTGMGAGDRAATVRRHYSLRRGYKSECRRFSEPANPNYRSPHNARTDRGSPSRR